MRAISKAIPHPLWSDKNNYFTNTNGGMENLEKTAFNIKFILDRMDSCVKGGETEINAVMRK